ncbi:hypothetical protein ACWOFR_17410 [Carnobacterium gallinarum]|uniref:hypothetical protein n=1 Tax=Carnobacterium gallinarum TaxID=2749 RepID=UPI000552D1E0|nr:hypothetical protein [Carnobacterium gallinarum]
MKKKFLLVLMSLVVLTLTACGASMSGGSSKTTVNDYTKTISNYEDKQQDLMMKQSDMPSNDADELIKHAKEVVDSKEYKDWITASEKVAKLDVSELESSESFTNFITAISEYNKVQSEYFQELAKATNKEEYNAVNARIIPELQKVEDNYINLSNSAQ